MSTTWPVPVIGVMASFWRKVPCTFILLALAKAATENRSNAHVHLDRNFRVVVGVIWLPPFGLLITTTTTATATTTAIPPHPGLLPGGEKGNWNGMEWG